MSAYYYNSEFLDQYIGNGLSTSNTFNPSTYSTNSVTGMDKIRESIYTILSTKVGERFFLPEFGSRLYLLLFEQNNAVFADLADFYIRDALSKWEKRIEVTNVKVNIVEDGNTVPIEISYKVTKSNVYDSYIYPFHRNEFGEPEMYEQGTITADFY